jgi:hypothetical protein
VIATAQPDLDLRWFIPLFIAGWVGIGAFISLMGGWRTLAKKYRRVAETEGRPFAWSSMSMGWSSYKGVVFARLNVVGMALAVHWPFSFFHPKLFIPWKAVIECERERWWFRNCTAILLSEPKIRMRFYGKLGEAIYEFRNRSL